MSANLKIALKLLLLALLFFLVAIARQLWVSV